MITEPTTEKIKIRRITFQVLETDIQFHDDAKYTFNTLKEANDHIQGISLFAPVKGKGYLKSQLIIEWDDLFQRYFRYDLQRSNCPDLISFLDYNWRYYTGLLTDEEIERRYASKETYIDYINNFYPVEESKEIYESYQLS